MSGTSISKTGEDWQCNECEGEIADPSYSYCPHCGDCIEMRWDRNTDQEWTGEDEQPNPAPSSN